MSTKRTKVGRSAVEAFPIEAVDLFDAMEVCEDSEKWWDLHWKLHNLLNRKPWEWPCVLGPANYSAHDKSKAGFASSRQLYDDLRRLSDERRRK